MEPGRDPISDIEALEAELAACRLCRAIPPWATWRRGRFAVVLNKIDVPDARELADFVQEEVESQFGWPVYEISTVSRDGLRPLIFALWEMVKAYRDAQPVVVPRRPVIQPIAVDESGFTVETDGFGGFIVRAVPVPSAGSPRRTSATTRPSATWVTGWRGLGVEDELWKKGAKPGCAVTIGDMTFDWEPQTPAGVDMPLTGRGTDIRLGADRPGSARSRAQGRAQGASPSGERRRVTSVESAHSVHRGCDSDRAQGRRQDRHDCAHHPVRCVRRRGGWPCWWRLSKVA